DDVLDRLIGPRGVVSRQTRLSGCSLLGEALVDRGKAAVGLDIVWADVTKPLERVTRSGKRRQIDLRPADGSQCFARPGKASGFLCEQPQVAALVGLAGALDFFSEVARNHAKGCGIG